MKVITMPTPSAISTGMAKPCADEQAASGTVTMSLAAAYCADDADRPGIGVDQSAPPPTTDARSPATTRTYFGPHRPQRKVEALGAGGGRADHERRCPRQQATSPTIQLPWRRPSRRARRRAGRRCCRAARSSRPRATHQAAPRQTSRPPSVTMKAGMLEIGDRASRERRRSRRRRQRPTTTAMIQISGLPRPS